MAGSPGHADIREAVRRGVTRLQRLQEGGRWSGFPTLAGRSDVWVTGFVAAHLRAGAPQSPALTAARDFLVAQRRPGAGWSYGGDVPADADSTAWCLEALRQSRRLSAAARSEAQRFLESHQSEEGTATFREDSGIRQYVGAPTTASMQGWTSAHPDVTAVALLAGVPRPGSKASVTALGRLVLQQSGAGLWDAYWWRGPFYTTAMLLRAADRLGYRLPDPVARRVLAALGREQLASGGFGLGASDDADPFTTALALDCYTHLAYLGDTAGRGRDRAVAVLLRQQADDGAWQGNHTMRIPAPDVIDPRHVAVWRRDAGGGNSFVEDTGGVFATAMAVHALARCAGRARVVAASPVRTLPVPLDADDDASVVTLRRR